MCDFTSSVEHKRRYFEECWYTVLVPVDFYYMDKKKPTEIFLKISSLMFHKNKKVIQVWNDIMVSK